MNSSEVRSLATELQSLVGAPLRSVWQPDRDGLLLEVGSRLVHIDVGVFPCVLLPDRRPAQPRRPFSFQGACRARLHGRLAAAEAGPDARLTLRFSEGVLVVVLGGSRRGVWLEDSRISLHGPRDFPLAEADDERPSRWDPALHPSIVAWLTVARAEAHKERAAHAEARRVRTERARWERLEQALVRDLEAAGRHDDLRRRAEALANVVHALNPGARVVDAPDPDGDGTLRLTLDPATPPRQQLEHWARRAAALRKAIPTLERRLSQVRARLAGEDLALSDARAEHSQARPRAWRHERWRFRVGRSAAQNHELLRDAPRGAVWFHLRDHRSAHGMLHEDAGRSPPREVVLACAALLAGATGADGEVVDVMYAPANAVVPVPGSPGSVRARNAQTVRVRGATQARGWEPEARRS